MKSEDMINRLLKKIVKLCFFYKLSPSVSSDGVFYFPPLEINNFCYESTMEIFRE